MVDDLRITDRKSINHRIKELVNKQYLFFTLRMISLQCFILPRLDSSSFRIKFYTVISLSGIVVFHAGEMISFSVAISYNFCFLRCLRRWSCCWNWRDLWCALPNSYRVSNRAPLRTRDIPHSGVPKYPSSRSMMVLRKCDELFSVLHLSFVRPFFEKTSCHPPSGSILFLQANILRRGMRYNFNSTFRALPSAPYCSPSHNRRLR
jgi:hypothetical protein